MEEDYTIEKPGNKFPSRALKVASVVSAIAFPFVGLTYGVVAIAASLAFAFASNHFDPSEDKSSVKSTLGSALLTLGVSAIAGLFSPLTRAISFVSPYALTYIARIPGASSLATLAIRASALISGVGVIGLSLVKALPPVANYFTTDFIAKKVVAVLGPLVSKASDAIKYAFDSLRERFSNNEDGAEQPLAPVTKAEKQNELGGPSQKDNSVEDLPANDNEEEAKEEIQVKNQPLNK